MDLVEPKLYKVIAALPYGVNNLLLTFATNYKINKKIKLHPFANTVEWKCCTVWPFVPCCLWVLLVPTSGVASIYQIARLPHLSWERSRHRHSASNQRSRAWPSHCHKALRSLAPAVFGWPPETTAAWELKAWGLLQCHVCSTVAP